MSTDDDYKVGYGKPPLQTRFAKGASGNPKGRPRKTRAASADDELLDQPCVSVRIGGIERCITGREAIFRGLMQKALKGDTRAASKLLSDELKLQVTAAKALGAGPGGRKPASGFMLVPTGTEEDWERQALLTQQALIDATQADRARS